MSCEKIVPQRDVVRLGNLVVARRSTESQVTSCTPGPGLGMMYAAAYVHEEWTLLKLPREGIAMNRGRNQGQSENENSNQ